MRWPFPEDRVALIGVVHLLPLPGAPAGSPGMAAVLARAAADATALAAGGVDAIIVENLGDAPFAAGSVEPATVAALTRCALAVSAAAPGAPLGINVLRNDAIAALGIAAAVGAAFIRVNVWVGAAVTDQGLITGAARAALLERNRLGAEIRIAADIHVKHATQLGGGTIAQAADDAWRRARADALIVTGAGTGKPTDDAELAAVQAAVPGAPVWVGSGVTPGRIPSCHAAIVGTWLHRDGNLALPVDAERVKAMRAAVGRQRLPRA